MIDRRAFLKAVGAAAFVLPSLPTRTQTLTHKGIPIAYRRYLESHRATTKDEWLAANNWAPWIGNYYVYGVNE